MDLTSLFLLFVAYLLFGAILLFVGDGIESKFVKKYNDIFMVFIVLYPYIFLREFIRQFKKIVSDDKYSKWFRYKNAKRRRVIF